MIPYALGLGALLGALSQVTPWAFCGLLVGLGFPHKTRWWSILAYVAVMVHGGFVSVPYQNQVGQWVQLSGSLRSGILQTPNGKVYVRYFPQLQDGFYTLEGRLEKPQGPRNPGGFDQAQWLRGLGIGMVLDAKAINEFRPFSAGLEAWLEGQLVSGLSPTAASLNRALTLGEKRGLDETYGEFQRAGLAHALALSGLNVGILAGFFVLVFYRFGHWRYLIALGLLMAYLLLVGLQPSLLRAVLMSGFVLIGLFFGKGKVEVFPALSLALCLHLLLEPYAIFSLSFQLSYLAVLGMAVVLPQLPKLEGWRNWVASAVSVTVAAQIFIFPLLLHTFHQTPLIAPLANLLVLPLLNALVPLGFIKLFLGGLVAWPVEWISQLALWMVGWLSRGPQLYWGAISWQGFCLYFLGILPLLLALHRRIDWQKAGLLSASALLASWIPAQIQRPEIWQLDIGQGDASLIRLPGNVEVLVDGGRAWAYSRLEGALRALGVDDIDIVVATHPDADHIEALPQVLEHFGVGLLITGPRKPGDEQDDLLRLTAQKQRVRVVQVGAGTALDLSGAKLRFLGPQGDELEDNERSVVFVLEYRNYKALFTGDAPFVSEKRWKSEKVDILKVGHHGSATSTSDGFLDAFQPKVALIGVGNNTYGHPTQSALDRLNRHGVEIHRTDLEGAIRIPIW